MPSGAFSVESAFQGEEGTALVRAAREALVEALRQAVQSGELCVHYQPLVEIASRNVVGLEALLGWQHPKFGWVTPTSFMPIAELSGLIVPIGEFVLRTVCEQLAVWQREHIAVVPVAVNVAHAQLASGQFEGLVRNMLERTGIESHLLALEVSERLIRRYAQRSCEVLQGLRSTGISIHLDDFGGESLSDVGRLPIDTVKIDRKLIARLPADPIAAGLVREALTFIQSLGLRAVAVGVETIEQRELLWQQGCKLAQGFLYCRPLPVGECHQMLLSLMSRTCITDTLRIKLASIPPGASTITSASALDRAERAIARARRA
jgi:EAL domain-containing protein (putative c-di-GMP-specific phosphodiesterase class I)